MKEISSNGIMDFNERVRRRNEFDASIVYGTREFNILTGRDKHLSHRKNHDDDWLNDETGMIHEKFQKKRISKLQFMKSKKEKVQIKKQLSICS